MRAISADEAFQLDEIGLIVLPAFFGDILARIQSRIEEIFVEEGDRAGSEFKQEPGSRRLANLMDKDALFQQVVAHPRLKPYVRHVLGEQFKLSSLNVRSVNP